MLRPEPRLYLSTGPCARTQPYIPRYGTLAATFEPKDHRLCFVLSCTTLLHMLSMSDFTILTFGYGLVRRNHLTPCQMFQPSLACLFLTTLLSSYASSTLPQEPCFHQSQLFSIQWPRPNFSQLCRLHPPSRLLNLHAPPTLHMFVYKVQDRSLVAPCRHHTELHVVYPGVTRPPLIALLWVSLFASGSLLSNHFLPYSRLQSLQDGHLQASCRAHTSCERNQNIVGRFAQGLSIASAKGSHLLFLQVLPTSSYLL